MSQAIIWLENVSLEDEKVFLKEITLKIYPKETYLLTGPTSAEKTALLRVCLGFTRPQKGKVYIGNYNFTTATYSQLLEYRHKLQISYITHTPILISNQSILQNIIFPLKYHSPKDCNILKKAEEVINLFELNGYEDKRPFELSVEEKRRVEFARALITQPQIIFYNQPLEGFDMYFQQKLVEIIKQFSKKKTCTSIIATGINDYQQFMSIADQIGILNHGQLLYSGSPEGLCACERPEIQEFIK